MTLHKIFRTLLLALLCAAPAVRVFAQKADCLPPGALPTSSEPNIFVGEKEVFLGEAIAERIQKDYKVIEEPELIGYLSRIGERLSRHLPPNSLRLQFFIVDLPDANAFVIPGGRIYVSRKLVASAQSEDDLAGVIAHELGHLVTHEGAIDQTRLFREVLGVTEVRDRRDVFEKYNQLLDNVMRKPGAFRARDREKGQLAADQAGFYALVKAGYDPAALARFWDRMTETKGKTGSWVSDFFGTTRPEERRLREMLKAEAALPASCVETRAASAGEEFKRWQAAVVSFTGTGKRESLHDVVAKRQLSPPLQSDVTHLRFSPDGKYILAQDDSGINVLTREPFAPLFRIEAPEANPAGFTPDSREVLFYTDNLRVERWDLETRKMANVHEVVVRKGCLQTALSPDGKFLACLTPEFDLNLINVASGEAVVKKKGFYEPGRFDLVTLFLALLSSQEDGDLGLQLVNMDFSPDGRYFAAGYSSMSDVGMGMMNDVAKAYDLTALAEMAVPDSVKKLIAGGFTFMPGDRLAGIHRADVKKSGVIAFPSGKVLATVELWRKGMAAPTRGDYLLIRPIKEYPLGVLDINSKAIVRASRRSAMDIYGDVMVAEMRDGQLGLYRMDKTETVATVALPKFTLGRLRVAELSPDLKWLALSGRSRGGVWDMSKGQSVLTLRGFDGGFLTDDGYFYGDFPKYQEAERNVAKFNLTSGEVAPGPRIEANGARQVGQYIVSVKPIGSGAKDERWADYRRNVTLEISDARTLSPLWSKPYPKEAPKVWVAPSHGTVSLLWDIAAEAARAEIKGDPRLSQQLGAMKEKAGDYFLQVLSARDGSILGKILIETGKGSFRLSNVFAAGDHVVVSDTQNRVLVYSLSTGELKGRVFGGYAAVPTAGRLLCVENETGQLTLYNIESMEKLDQFTFPSPVAVLRFSDDGHRLFVLTSDQVAYTLDTSGAAKK